MKVLTTKSYLLVFTLSFLLMLNCKKSSDHRFDGSVQLKLDAEGLQYVQLDVGKYFIYKDSASGKLDSVVVTKSLLENVFIPAVTSGGFTYSAYNSEIFSLTLTKTDANGETIWLDAKTPPALCCPSLSSNNQSIQMSDSAGLVFCYPSSECNSVDLISSLTLEGKTYQDVIKVPGGANSASTYYWAKDVGLIKRIETLNSDTQTYTLIRNN
jgi:hypothetical protein